jgi:hypothetical protein
MSTKTLAVDDTEKARFDEFQWENRCKSQTEALKKLLDLAGVKLPEKEEKKV